MTIYFPEKARADVLSLPLDHELKRTLSWKYLSYVKENPIVWNTATDILYAGNDNLTSYETICEFAEKTNSSLKIMEDGEHWFHTEEQLTFLDNWLISII